MVYHGGNIRTRNHNSRAVDCGEQVTEAQIPGLDGYLGVLPGHAALLGELGFGELSYKTGDTLHRVVVHGGFVEINGDTTRVLCSSAEMPDQIDL